MRLFRSVASRWTCVLLLGVAGCAKQEKEGGAETGGVEDSSSGGAATAEGSLKSNGAKVTSPSKKTGPPQKGTVLPVALEVGGTEHALVSAILVRPAPASIGGDSALLFLQPKRKRSNTGYAWMGEAGWKKFSISWDAQVDGLTLAQFDTAEKSLPAIDISKVNSAAVGNVTMKVPEWGERLAGEEDKKSSKDLLIARQGKELDQRRLELVSKGDRIKQSISRLKGSRRPDARRELRELEEDLSSIDRQHREIEREAESIGVTLPTGRSRYQIVLGEPKRSVRLIERKLEVELGEPTEENFRIPFRLSKLADPPANGAAFGCCFARSHDEGLEILEIDRIASLLTNKGQKPYAYFKLSRGGVTSFNAVAGVPVLGGASFNKATSHL